jgi:hypothetical protein
MIDQISREAKHRNRSGDFKGLSGGTAWSKLNDYQQQYLAGRIVLQRQLLLATEETQSCAPHGYNERPFHRND